MPIAWLNFSHQHFESTPTSYFDRNIDLQLRYQSAPHRLYNMSNAETSIQQRRQRDYLDIDSAMAQQDQGRENQTKKSSLPDEDRQPSLTQRVPPLPSPHRESHNEASDFSTGRCSDTESPGPERPNESKKPSFGKRILGSLSPTWKAGNDRGGGSRAKRLLESLSPGRKSRNVRASEAPTLPKSRESSRASKHRERHNDGNDVEEAAKMAEDPPPPYSREPARTSRDRSLRDGTDDIGVVTTMAEEVSLVDQMDIRRKTAPAPTPIVPRTIEEVRAWFCVAVADAANIDQEPHSQNAVRPFPRELAKELNSYVWTTWDEESRRLNGLMRGIAPRPAWHPDLDGPRDVALKEMKRNILKLQDIVRLDFAEAYRGRAPWLIMMQLMHNSIASDQIRFSMAKPRKPKGTCDHCRFPIQPLENSYILPCPSSHEVHRCCFIAAYSKENSKWWCPNCHTDILEKSEALKIIERIAIGRFDLNYWERASKSP